MKNEMSSYALWLTELKSAYRQAQLKAAVAVNSALLHFYYSLGREIVTQNYESSYGSGFFKKLSRDLRKEIPDASGFSVSNLRYMKWFYERYSGHLLANNSSEGLPEIAQQAAVESKESTLSRENAQQLAVELFSIPWGHHMAILGKTKSADESLFYVHETYANGWSRGVLLNFLKSDLYSRQGKAITNFGATLVESESDLAQQLTRDPYDFNFISIERKYKEKQLKDALMANLQQYLLELGNGFAFLGREVRIQIGEKEKFMDMLFYNIRLHCYVVVEVKVDDLDSENLGQLGLYVNAVNHLFRKEGDAPTIGLLIVGSKDEVFAKYALGAMSVPIGIAEYTLTNFLPEELKSDLPSVEDIEESIK